MKVIGVGMVDRLVDNPNEIGLVSSIAQPQRNAFAMAPSCTLKDLQRVDNRFLVDDKPIAHGFTFVQAFQICVTISASR